MGAAVVFTMIGRLFRRKSPPPERAAPSAKPADNSVRYTTRARFGSPSLTLDEIDLLSAEVRAHSNVPRTASILSDMGKTIGRVQTIEPSERGAQVYGDAGSLQVSWVAADCLHVLRAGDNPIAGQPTLNSQALQLLNAPLTLEWGGDDEAFRMASGVAECVISKRDGTLAVCLSDGSPAFAETGSSFLRASGSARCSIRLTNDMLCSGFGAHVHPLNLRGTQLEVYSAPHNGIIATVPFALLVTPKVSCGVYWRSSARLHVDAGSTHTGELTVDIEEPCLDYFILVSPSPVGVLARFASLLPTFPLPPVWALGTHVGGDACVTSSHVRRLITEFREHGFPMTALQLGGTLMDGGRPLTINADRFPEFSELVDELHQGGTQVILEVHPAVRVDTSYPLYSSGVSRNVFTAYANNTPVRAAAATGMSVFPDFMRDDVRTWWSEQMRPLVRTGIDGVGVYSAGPDIITRAESNVFPDTALHQMNGVATPHSDVRARYSGMMTTACRTALEKDRGALRPFVRQSGGTLDIAQQGALTVETGGDWDGLRAGVRAALNAGLSGIQLAGLEITANDGEVLARALQAGCLMPSLLLSLNRDPAAFPWSFGEGIENACRETLLLRSHLLPYLYGCIALAREYGVPVIRPLWMLDSANPTSYGIEDAFMIGDHLLFAPILSQGKTSRPLHLPDGLWYDYWTNEALEGGVVRHLEAPLNRVPLLVRAGAVLHLAPDVNAANGGRIRIYPGNSDSTFYDDPGEGFSYLHGDYRWVYYTCNWEANHSFVVNRRRTGGFFPSDKRLRIEVVGLGGTPDEVRLDRYGASLWYFDQGVLEVVADDDASRLEVWMEGSPTSPTRKRRAL